MTCFVYCIFSLCVFGITEAKDFVTASFSIPNVTTVALIFMKTFITYYHKEKIWGICQELKAIFTRHEESQIKKNLIQAYFSEYILEIRIYGCICVFVFVPIAFPIYKYIAYGTMEFTVDYWFPFDEYNPRLYPIALLFIVFVCYHFLTYLLATDAILFVIMKILAMEFHILRIDFENLKLIKSDELKNKLESLINHHQKLLDCGDDLQDIYELMFFYNFGISALILCVLAFQLLFANDANAYTFVISYFLLIAGQAFILCLNGQKVADNSMKVAEGAYFNGWEDFHCNKIMKQNFFIILRSQRAKQLTAMGFADISLSSFAQIITTTWSYFSLLKRVSSYDD
ncbi:CLUMA_CG015586, isoform A [Clunio marinus]|uniref:Odorant receptor n=1 Tax=Clunio marinus TaxID=568069 RepID=A0A1J1IP13_9DIPT|nr:CLUMA_CG015586, isoform A [Clunio marinus]